MLMNVNLVVCIPVMIAHMLSASTLKEATAVSANLATKVMYEHAKNLVIIYVSLNYDGII